MANYWKDRGPQTRSEGTYLEWNTDHFDWNVVEKGKVITHKTRGVTGARSGIAL